MINQKVEILWFWWLGRMRWLIRRLCVWPLVIDILIVRYQDFIVCEFVKCRGDLVSLTECQGLFSFSMSKWNDIPLFAAACSSRHLLPAMRSMMKWETIPSFDPRLKAQMTSSKRCSCAAISGWRPREFGYSEIWSLFPQKCWVGYTMFSIPY
jgi:hypothetical protein